jgi:hypothetical protein
MPERRHALPHPCRTVEQTSAASTINERSSDSFLAAIGPPDAVSQLSSASKRSLSPCMCVLGQPGELTLGLDAGHQTPGRFKHASTMQSVEPTADGPR